MERGLHEGCPQVSASGGSMTKIIIGVVIAGVIAIVVGGIVMAAIGYGDEE